MARFCPLFSGSSGNAYFIGSEKYGVLIDAGKSAKQLTTVLERCSIPISAVQAIFVTHEHADHISGVRVFASRHHLPVFASAGTLEEMEKMGCLKGVEKAIPFPSGGVECAGMYINSFRTSHDSAESIGYQITTQDERKLSIATDLGFMSDTVRNAITGSDLIVLESNHDVGMLRNGFYPYPLKRRILSDTGHLSNEACADELCGFVKSGTTRFFLAHLSKENNTPDLAHRTSLCALTMNGFQDGLDFQLSVAPRENIEGKVTIF